MWLLLFFACGTNEQPPPPLVVPPVVKEEPPPPPRDTAPPVPVNLKPRITQLELIPADPKTNNDLRVLLQTEDPDGDILHTERTWYQNDEEVFGVSGRYFPSSQTKKGDRIYMEVVVEDKQDKVVGRSQELTILNSPPQIMNQTRDLENIDGFAVRAKDIDGDTLSYRLEGAPMALTIDPERGVLHYQGTAADPAGQYQVKIVVDDGDNGWAEWSFGLSIAAGSEARKKKEEEEEETER